MEVKTPTINLHHGDCLEAMKQMPDKAYDLAIKRVLVLKKQDSSWNITSTHKFTFRNYEVDEFGNFYRDGKIADVKPDGKGSKFFLLIDDENKRVRFKAHQIVMQTFFPKGLKNGFSVDHKDRNRLNNSLSNLRYANHSEQYSNRENIVYKYKSVICINNGKKYKSCQHAEQELGLVHNTVSRVARGERKSIHGYKFKYAEE